MDEASQYKHGVVVCKDGSLSGSGYTSAEFVTVPMNGAKGLQNITDVCTVLSNRTNIDINCSLHIHFGNVPINRLYIVSIYRLSYLLQDQLFKMFPFYKQDYRAAGKRKNYCQKLKQMGIHSLKDFSKEGYESYINETYVTIFKFLSDGQEPSRDNNITLQRHPIAQKFHRHSR